MNCYRWHHWLVVAMRVGVLSMLVMLCACQPEQTPASAARTAAAVRTPAAPPVAQATANAPATLAPASSLATAPPQPRQTPQASPPSLTASPNPLPLGASAMGTTKISWNTGQPVDGQVYVSENGGSETLFSSGPTGSQDAPWIQPDHRYEFRLYMGTTHDQRLATLTIGNPSTEVAASPARKPSVRTDLAADPNPVPADDRELGTTIVTWSTETGGDIYVSEDDGPEELFASGIHGSAQAYWICRGSTYEFRLYAGGQRAEPLKTLTVTRADEAPDHEPPPVVACKESPGQ